VKFSIHGAAERELLDAAKYYRERGGPQLAESLVEEFERAYALLRAFPILAQPGGKRLGSSPLSGFRTAWSIT
jgi:plasmid stabilization system protein ParE